MTTSASRVLVIGATGRQGGSVVEALADRPITVRALTRDPRSPAARALAARGVKVVRGDLEDVGGLADAMAGVDAVFSVQDFMAAGVEGEVRQGRNIVEAARRAEVAHLVYSSVGGAERESGVPHFESKGRVEEAVRASGLAWTILRPVFFMENWAWWAQGVREGALVQPLSPTTALQQIAVRDVGRFAALALTHPEAWRGRAMEIAGDELTMEETAARLAEGLGRPVRYEPQPWEAFEAAFGHEMRAMYEWFEREGYRADLDACRAALPDLAPLTVEAMDPARGADAAE